MTSLRRYQQAVRRTGARPLPLSALQYASMRDAYRVALNVKAQFDRARDKRAAKARADAHAQRITKRAAFYAACAWDEIDPAAPFCVFSRHNPYRDRANLPETDA